MHDWTTHIRQRFAAAGAACSPDVVDELAAHAESAYTQARRDGASAADADVEVGRLIDGWVADAPLLTRPWTRPAPSPPPMVRRTGGREDLRYAVRLLRRAPGFTAVAIVTLALGIGATTLLFGVVDGVLLKPLPWLSAERLVRVTETRDGRSGRVAGTVSNAAYHAWREARTTIEDIGGWRAETATLTGAGEASRVTLTPTTTNLFSLLGVQPHLGRGFLDDDGRPGQTGAALLSHGLWEERFGASDAVLGRVIALDGVPYTIVGVMPPGFVFPDATSRLWTAWQVQPVRHESGALAAVIFRAVARLREGMTASQAAAEGTARARTAPDLGVAAQALFGAVGPVDVSVTAELDAVTREVRPAMWLLLAASLLLLATATGNIASLQLARAVARRQEMAVRAALGAGQARMARQVLLENLVVGVAGGGCGLMLAAVCLRVLPVWLPEGVPRLDAVAPDLRVASFATAMSVAVSLACGWLPAWQMRRLDLVASLSEGALAPLGGTVRTPLARMRALIMTAQVAIACLLLVGAGLLTRSWLALVETDRGFDAASVLTARLALPRAYPPEQRVPLLDALLARVTALPGVAHAGYSPSLPLLSPGGFVAFGMRRPDAPDVEVPVQATQRIVSPGYFAAMGLRLVAGRLLTERDGPNTPPVVVVNRTFARRYLGGQAVGSRIPPAGPRAGYLTFVTDGVPWEVVGVVDDMRQDAMDGEPQPEIFASFRQLVTSQMRFDPVVVLRTSVGPATLVPALRAALHDVAPTLALDSVMTMEDRIAAGLARPRLYALVLGWFGAFAILIAGVGLFGVLTFSITQRTREIGVRAALGAGGRDIVTLVLRQAVWIVGVGSVLGTGVAFAGARGLSSVLHGVHPHDPVTFVAVPVAVAVVAVVACAIPARRAARIDPLRALRHD